MKNAPGLKLSLKLTAIGLAFVLPLTILFVLSIQNINGQIAFSRFELYGDAYLRPLEILLERLPAYARAPGEGESDIRKGFDLLEKANQEYGEALQFTDEGLGIRNRSHLQFPLVKQRWEEIASAGSADPGGTHKKTWALIDDVMNMIAHAGDTSNLILDPDLDSYYMMDLVLLALPATQRRLAEITDFGLAALASGTLRETDRRKFNSYAEILQDSDLNRIVGSANTSLNEDPNFYGVSPTLAGAIKPVLASYTQHTEAFIKLLREIADGAQPGVTPAQFAAAAENARNAAFRFWDAGVNELDAFLDVRIGDYASRRLLMVVATGFALIFAALLSYFIGRGVNRTILGMTEYADKISSGDLAAAFHARGSTRELITLGNDIRGMVRSLKEKLGFSQGILDGLAIPCVVAGPDGKILFLNGRLCSLLGKTEPAERYLGVPLSGFFTNNPKIAELLQEAIRTQQPIVGLEYEGRDAKGDYFCAVMDASMVYDLDHKPLGAIAQLSEYTEIKRQGDRLLERNKVIAGLADSAADIAGLVNSAAEDLSAVVEQTRNGAVAQKDRSHEVATAMEQMNATVMEVARNASGAAEQAEQTMGKAREGAATVNTSVEAIGKVKEQTDRLKERIAVLGRQAEGIDRIMNVISDIADQTNLLALNAAIEAARAGEAGRGFAVVADEVRKLAEKTMNATKEVGEAITGIQNGAKEAETGMDVAADSVAEATELAKRSGGALEQILTLAGRTSDQVRSIAAAAEEQSAASEEIARSVDQVNVVADETAAGMEQSVGAVDRLRAQAVELTDLFSALRR